MIGLPPLTTPMRLGGHLVPDGNANLARARHAHRAWKPPLTLDHGTALLVALGLPQLVDAGYVQVHPEVVGDHLDAAIALLDALDPDPDLRPSLGAPKRHSGGYGFGITRDDRPSSSQAYWSDGGDVDGDDPLEKNGDDEEALGWAANVSQLALGSNTADGDLTAPALRDGLRPVRRGRSRRRWHGGIGLHCCPEADDPCWSIARPPRARGAAHV